MQSNDILVKNKNQKVTIDLNNLGLSGNPTHLTNRWVTFPEHDEFYVSNVDKYYEEEQYLAFTKRGKTEIRVVPLRASRVGGVFCDALTFTFGEETIQKYTRGAFSDEDVLHGISILCEELFGFGIVGDKLSSPWFYEGRYLLGDPSECYGYVHFGGQKGTICIELRGTGCLVAKPNWELRLHHFLAVNAVRGKITRCDLARDFFNGEITPDKAFRSWSQGGFSVRGKRPLGAKVGSDWLNDTNEGKTFYIGSRQSPKFTRVYEKGKQLGEETSKWVRFEIEFKSGGHAYIPFEILVTPDAFWSGAYPICQRFKIVDSEELRVLPTVKKLDLAIESVKENAKSAVGRAVNLFLKLGMSSSDIVSMLKPRHDDLPKRLNPASFWNVMNPNLFMHNINQSNELGGDYSDYEIPF